MEQTHSHTSIFRLSHIVGYGRTPSIIVSEEDRLAAVENLREHVQCCIAHDVATDTADEIYCTNER
jgi:hypothetical protein